MQPNIKLRVSKLPKAYKFIDFSDYGRPIAKVIANTLKDTSATPIHVTWAFVACGLCAIIGIFTNHFCIAALLLIWKSILDAADGELARVKQTPSFTGRYFDSIADILLNLAILTTIMIITNSNVLLTIIAFLGIQLQGTLYNYYYVILRNKVNGDTTSRVFEDQAPIALKGETQRSVNILYNIYRALYKYFDKTIYQLDKKAVSATTFPKWFMTLVSIMGLGSQLMIISVLLIANRIDLIIPFFAYFTLFIFVFIAIRHAIENKSLI